MNKSGCLYTVILLVGGLVWMPMSVHAASAVDKELLATLDALHALVRTATKDGQAAMAESPLTKKLKVGKGVAASKKLVKLSKGLVDKSKALVKQLAGQEKAANAAVAKCQKAREGCGRQVVQLTKAHDNALAMKKMLAELEKKLLAQQASPGIDQTAYQANVKLLADLRVTQTQLEQNYDKLKGELADMQTREQQVALEITQLTQRIQQAQKQLSVFEKELR